LVGGYSSVLEKTALITASSEIYSRHFSLVADRFNDPARAYSIIEQVRGRAATDLLMAGAVTTDEARKAERAIAQLRLKLMSARSTDDLHRLRDQIFLAEQSRWITPEVSILKAQSRNTISLDLVQRSLGNSAVILEYVVADPRSYCLVISRTGSHVVPLAGSKEIEPAVTTYLKAVKAKQPAHAEARSLYNLLLQPIPEATRKETLVVVRDGRLHLVPFDGLIDASGRYVAVSRNVVYAPSASSFYLLAGGKRVQREFSRELLALGGVPYSLGELKQISLTRGYDANDPSDLPASRFEILAAEAAVRGRSNTILLGPDATESAFKRAGPGQHRIIHLAVHGFASTTHPDRSALVLLRDPAKGEDGFLQASEIVQLPLNAELVILSACDTAVGPVHGEEGIATLSRAFLLAGTRAVVSTLWSIDDTFSLYLMKQFYRHLAGGQPPAYALSAAKRDMLRKFGRAAVPYYWAGFTFEGALDRAFAASR
jgi:CHAT domain-containing protein